MRIIELRAEEEEEVKNTNWRDTSEAQRGVHFSFSDGKDGGR